MERHASRPQENLQPIYSAAFAGTIAYFMVQYIMYLGMGTFNELFLLWVVLAGLSLHAFVRIMVEIRDTPQTVPPRRGYVSVFLVLNGLLMAALWLQLILVPLFAGTLFPAGLAHFTTLIVQGFDLAFFLPPSIMAGWAYGKGKSWGLYLAPVYAVFLSLQMGTLLAKIVGMTLTGVDAGPVLVIIPLLLLGALAAAFLSLKKLNPAGHEKHQKG